MKGVIGVDRGFVGRHCADPSSPSFADCDNSALLVFSDVARFVWPEGQLWQPFEEYGGPGDAPNASLMGESFLCEGRDRRRAFHSGMIFLKM